MWAYCKVTDYINSNAIAALYCKSVTILYSTRKNATLNKNLDQNA